MVLGMSGLSENKQNKDRRFLLQELIPQRSVQEKARKRMQQKKKGTDSCYAFKYLARLLPYQASKQGGTWLCTTKRWEAASCQKSDGRNTDTIWWGEAWCGGAASQSPHLRTRGCRHNQATAEPLAWH